VAALAELVAPASARTRRRARFWASLRNGSAYVVPLTLLLLATRADSLREPHLLNPDEAELMAEGRRAALTLFPPYKTYTEATHGFVWPAFLGLLHHLGMPMTLSAAHVLSGLSYLYLTSVACFLLAGLRGRLWAWLLVFPIALHLFAAQGDFRSLGTELLPVVLLTTSAWVLVRSKDRLSATRLTTVGVLAGLVPWAKPQGVVLSAAVLSVAAVFCALSRRPGDDAASRGGSLRRDLLALAGGALLPSLLFLIAMLLTGVFHTFVVETVHINWAYLVSRGKFGGVPVTWPDRMGAVGSAVLSHPLALLIALSGLIGSARVFEQARALDRALFTLAWGAPFCAAAVTLVLGMPVFPHYANYLYAGGLLSALTGPAAAGYFGRGADVRAAARGRAPLVLGAGLVILLTCAEATPSTIANLQNLDAAGSSAGLPAIAKQCPAGSRVLVWGWAAEQYAYYDWLPATRYVVSGWLLAPTGNEANYRHEFEGEILREPPRCVMQALGPDFFFNYPPSAALSTVSPTIGQLLVRCYVSDKAAIGGGPEVQLWVQQRPAPAGCDSAHLRGTTSALTVLPVGGRGTADRKGPTLARRD
jgi:hypothetical protein